MFRNGIYEGTIQRDERGSVHLTSTKTRKRDLAVQKITKRKKLRKFCLSLTLNVPLHLVKPSIVLALFMGFSVFIRSALFCIILN